MKTKKILEFTLLATIFLLLTNTIALASKEVEVESIACPFTITIGKFDKKGKFIGTETLTFEEYLKGVVYKEMWLAGITSQEALKAQAVAARSYAIYLKDVLKRHKGDGYDLCNQEHCQAWLPKPAGGYDPPVISAVDNTSGIGITYSDSNIDATYFSSSRNHYTKNAEDYWPSYCPYRRKTITPETTGAGGHGVGMSQYGAKSLAENGVTYQDILKHYYGPVSPYVKKVIVTQDGKPKYEASWVDNNDYPNPTRNLIVSTNEPLNGEADAIIEIHFSEKVLAGAGASEIKIKVEDEEASYISGSLIEGNNPPEKLKKKLTKEQLKNIGDGEHRKIKIDAKHEYAQEWQLDKNPSTFCYQEHNASNLKNYEEGIDENHKIKVDTTPPQITSINPKEEEIINKEELKNLEIYAEFEDPKAGHLPCTRAIL